MESRRHALVIGSQCDALERLDFVPDRVDRLISLLTDPRRGGCEPEHHGSLRLIDPTVADLRPAVEEAVVRASAAQATLIICFIGHGVTRPMPNGELKFFLMPTDGNAVRPRPETAYDIGSHLAFLLSDLDIEGLDGLMLVIDACHAGVGALEVMFKAGTLTGSTRLLVLGSTFDEVSYEGCFSRSLIALMQNGLPQLSSDYIGGQEAANAGVDACGEKQQETFLTMATSGRPGSDRGLFVTRNVAAPHSWALAGTAEGEQAVSLTQGFQPSHDLERVMGALFSAQLVVLVGRAGSGKSALVSAMARPELLPGHPSRFLAAVSYASLSRTLPEVADSLAEQLDNTPGFPDAETAFRHATDPQEYENLPALERRVFGPLKKMKILERIRIVLDGADQLDRASQKELISTVVAANSAPGLERVSVLLTTRPDTTVDLNSSDHAVRLDLRLPRHEEMVEYLTARGVANGLTENLAQHAWTWLELALVSDIRSGLSEDAMSTGTFSLEDLYGRWLATNVPGSDHEGGPLLAVLAAGGSGPVLPVSVTVAACTRLGGPTAVPRLRDVLLRLGPVTTRANPGTEAETLGLFHETLVHHLCSETVWADLVMKAHEAILAELEVITDPAAQTYRRTRAAEHLWALERYDEALDAVTSGLDHRANDNRNILESWDTRSADVLPSTSVSRLFLRGHLAHWTGEAGDPAAALTKYRELLDAQMRVLGPDHPNTLTTRSNLAAWTGEAGDPAGALNQFRELLDAQLRVQGPDHPSTLTTRNNLAAWTGYAGDPASALNQFRELLDAQLRVFGPEHPSTLTTRSNLATWTGRTGDLTGALNQFRELLDAQLRVFGPDHPSTLTTRSNLAHWTGHAGDPAGALTQFRELLDAQLRVLGPDHPSTLTTRSNLASWTAEAGNLVGALTQFRELLDARLRVLGPDHPDTLTTRNSLATWTGEAGDPAGALTQFRELLDARLRVLGPDHPDTLTTRNSLATWTGEAGDPAGALNQCRELLDAQLRVLGPDHPDTLTTRNNLAAWTGEAGDPAGAITQFRELLDTRLRVLGPVHPDTLTTRSNLALWTGHAGDPAGAITQFRELLDTRLRVLGPDHRRTLTTRNNLAYWTAEAGDPAGAITQYRELLDAQLRVLGPDHPSTLTTRNNLATGIGHAGDPAGALTQFRALLDAQMRVLGPDHPVTLTTRSNLVYWIRRAGDLAGALTQCRELLDARVRVLGPDHPDTFTTRNNLAYWTGEAGDPAGALTQFRELLDAQLRVLGPDRRRTLTTRSNLATWTGHTGDLAGALTQFRELLDARVRVLGPDHSDTLTTRYNLAYWTAKAGDPAAALTKYRELLDAQMRVLGPDHPRTLTTCNNLAYWTAKAGDPAGALNQFRKLLDARLRVLGPDHPDTLTTRNNLNYLEHLATPFE
jgi:tetratricopeptide (TPR) repeat protein